MRELISEYRASIDLPDVTPADHREIADEMDVSAKLADSAAQRVAGFVRGIKAETRDLSSKEFCHFNPVPVIEETLLLLGHAARAANCTVTLKPERPVLDLFGSPSRLAQVVTNLVTNAIDASAVKGGGPVDLVLSTWDRGLELRVTDRGAGIAPENLNKIFYPMYTSKPFGVGTGLGLTIVHDIVTGDFNGTIEVDSELGSGTSFVLKFRDRAD
jgi:signal transduction histidine kinase